MNNLDLSGKSSNVSIALSGCLLQLHDGDHGVGVVAEDADDRVDLVVEEDGAAGLELVLVDEGEDGDVVLGANAGGNDSVVVVDDFLEVANRHWCSSQVVNLAALLLVLLILGLQALLVPDELLLHEKIVLDPLHLEEPQPTLGVRSHSRQLVGSIGSLHLLALLT